MTAAGIAAFFRESSSSLGLFYPIHYIVAIFPTPAAALEARQALERASAGADAILLVPPSDALNFLQEFRTESGVVGGVMRSVSRFLGDDATFVDRDIEHARTGAGFLYIPSATEESMECIREIVRPFQPVSMRWYKSGGIESLV